jgi:hypothetical protein
MAEDKLIKNVIIARSGIYVYRAEELQNLGLNINEAAEKKETYNIYRPALVLSNDKDKFCMLPLTNGHPKELVDSENFKSLIIGYTGENVEVLWSNDQGELVLKTKVALFDKTALDNYYSGIDEVSPGYLAKFEFKQGKTDKNEAYDIIMTGILQGNHLAMTPHARGGKIACIIDSEGGKMANPLKFVSALWYNIKKIAKGVQDSDMGAFRNLSEEIAKNKDTLKDEEIKSKVDQLKDMAFELPDSENKSILNKYLEDFNLIKTQDTESALIGAQKISELFESLDTEAMKEGGEMKTAKDDGISLEYIAGELIKLAEAIKKGSSGNEDKPPVTDKKKGAKDEEKLDEKEANKKVSGAKDDDDDDKKGTKDDDEEKPEDKKEEKKPVTDKKKGAKDDDDDDKKGAKDEDKKEEKPEEKKEPKKSVGDSFKNITMDSSNIQGKTSLTDFFNTKIKGGRN